MKRKIKIIGAGGYGGLGIVELLLSHPNVEIAQLVAATETGVPISRLYPHLAGFCDLPVLAATDPEANEPADIVFMATPDGVGMTMAGAYLEAGAKVIDYSGDFRFDNLDAYADYATRIGRDPAHAAPDLLARTVYGLPELHRDRLTPDRMLVGNPGCFAVSCILGLAPAFSDGLVEAAPVICDCKTGVSGAGKKAAAIHHYPARYDNMNAYRLGGHQHVCEVERELSALAGAPVRVTFTAQVVPACRGILSTLYAPARAGVSADQALDCYREYYRAAPFVRVFDRSRESGTAHVRGSNFCNLVVDLDERTGMLRVVACIDNLMKGQAGSALQNMNLLCGWPDTMGLLRPGIYP